MTYFCINDGMVDAYRKGKNKYCPLCGLIVINFIIEQWAYPIRRIK